MAWVRLDESFPEHPKVVEAGPIAAWLLVRLICYCNRQLTDGYVPKAMAAQLGTKEAIQRLVAVGLLKPSRTGYLIHDYLEYQPSKAQVVQRRQEAKARMGRVRANFERTEREPDSPRTRPRTQVSLETGTPRRTGLRSIEGAVARVAEGLRE